jgi:hypothetical protein
MSSLVSLTPAQIVKTEDLQIVNLDLSKAMTRFEDTGKGFLAMGTFRLGKAAFKLLLRGELTTNGIACNEFNKVPNYSIGMQLDDQEDLEAFEKLNDLIITFLKNQNQKPEEWDLTSVVRDDRIYVKLKTNQKKSFEVLSNVKLDPKRLQESGLFRGQKVEVVAELAVYFNLTDKKAGITVGPRRLTFETESV